MKLTPPLCSLLHRRHWSFLYRQLTGTMFLARQRHIGVYLCKVCNTEHHIVGGPVLRADAYLALDGKPPVRGFAMRLHKLLGGPV